MPAPFAESPEFRRLIAGEADVSLLRVALEIARDAYPELNIELYFERVGSLADRVRSRCKPGAKALQILGQINWALFVEDGFQGDRETYFDPRNSYLNEVIDRRLGIPISLSVLYWTLSDQLGLKLGGVNLPGHFMLRLVESESPLFIDAFHSGEFLDHRACERRLSELTRQPVALSEAQTTPCSIPAVIARMLRNLKGIYLNSHDYMSVLPVQRRLAAVAAENPEEQRDLGMICLQVDRPGEAIRPLQAYLNARPESRDAENIHELLKTARRLIAQWN